MTHVKEEICNTKMEWSGEADRDVGQMAGDAGGCPVRLVRPDVSAANAALRQLLLRNVAAVPDQETLKPTPSGQTQSHLTYPSRATNYVVVFVDGRAGIISHIS